MAQRQRIQTGEGWIPEPAPIRADEGRLTQQEVDALNSALLTVARKINGGISFGNGSMSSWPGNVDGHFIIYTTPPAANTEFEIDHDIGRVPFGYIVLAQSAAGQLYTSNRGGWGLKKAYLKCSAASVSFAFVLV